MDTVHDLEDPLGGPQGFLNRIADFGQTLDRGIHHEYGGGE
jgi:hypothetical protein